MRILVIDDEKILADTLVLILQRAGHDARAAYSGPKALAELELFRADCVISDVIRPGMNGIEVCNTIQTKQPNCRILLFSGQAETNELVSKPESKDVIGNFWRNRFTPTSCSQNSRQSEL